MLNLYVLCLKSKSNDNPFSPKQSAMQMLVERSPTQITTNAKVPMKTNQPLVCIQLRKVHNLSRIHQPVRIKRCFDTSHYPDCVLAELLDKAMLLPKPDSVFTGTSTICRRSVKLIKNFHRMETYPSISRARSTMSWMTFSTASRSFGFCRS